MMDAKLKQIIAEALKLKIEAITKDLKQDDVPSWDSQSHLELVMAIEAAYSVEFEMTEVTELRCAADIEELIRKYQMLDQ